MKVHHLTALYLSVFSLACNVTVNGDGTSQGGQSSQPGIGGSTVGASGGSSSSSSGGSSSGGSSSSSSSSSGGAGSIGGSSTGGAAGGGTGDPHDGASRWIAFGHQFVKCTWFSADVGICSEAAQTLTATSTKATSLYRTSDGGHAWNLVATIDGGNTATDGTMNVYVLSPTEIWYTTGFIGFGFSGSVGRSLDGGVTWESLTDKVDRALAEDPDASSPLNASIYDLVKVGSAIWLNTGSWSQYFAMSPDGGTTWQRVLGPVSLATSQPPDFIATKDDLLLRYTTSTWGIALYRLSGGTFVATEGTFPTASGTDHGDTWWRASRYSSGVTFTDRRAWPFWGWPFLVSATFDGGRSFQSLYTAASQTQSGCEGLRDAFALEQGSSTVTYVSGVFLDSAQNRYAEIRKSTNNGTTWTTLHSEPGTTNLPSVQLDPTGKVHALRHTTDSWGNTFTYEAQYVIE